MRRNIRTRIRKATASILAATMILVSGGYTIVANMFGSTKNNNKNQMLENNNQIPITTIDSINTNETKKETKYQYKYEESKESYLSNKIITTEAISQQENINRLIRKRKKELEQKLKQ